MAGPRVFIPGEVVARSVNRPSEAHFIQRAVAGEGTAFEGIIGPLIEPAYHLAVTMLRDREEARDALQEATIKAWRNLRQLRDGMPVRPWFLAIVANQCRTVRRARWWSVLKLADLPRPAPASEDRLVRSVDLERALARLRSSDRLPLFLFFYLDLPLEEVAQTLGVGVAAAKSRIYRAAQKLRPGLEVEEVLS